MPKRADRTTELERENAELRRQLAESLAQQSATAEVLQVINASPGDLAPVFDALLERAMALCDVGFGALNTFDGEYFHLTAYRAPAELDAWVRDLRPTPAGAGTAMPALVRGENVVQILDLADTEAYRSGAPLLTALVDTGGYRTILAVALRKETTMLGALFMYRREVRPFTDKQIALLENFAAQAVIAMENARLLTETQEALDQQTATAEVLQVINSSPGDLAPVFDAMLAKALHLCEAAFGFLASFDGKRFHALAARGLVGEAADFFQDEQLWTPGPGSAMEQLLQGAPIVHIADVIDTEAYRSGVASRLKLVELTAARTALWVALRADEALVGGLVIYRREVRPFTDKQIALLQNFAAQAVIAIENARLLTETREALEQQTATAEVLQVINSSPGDLVPVFDAMLDKAMRLCDAALGSFCINNGERMPAVATRGYPEGHATVAREGLHTKGEFGVRLTRGEVIHVPDLRALVVPALDQAESRIRRAAVEDNGSRTYLAVPLLKDSSFLGYLSAHRREVRPFTDKQIALLQNFAAQAVIAMENARLLTETREALDQQTATAEVLQVINASPGDLAPVFDAILEKAHSLCDAGHGSLFLAEGEIYYPVAMRGVPGPFAERLRQGLKGREAVASEPLLRGEPYVHIVDLSQHESPLARAAAQLAGARTLVSVPLGKSDALLGYIVATRFEVRPFTDKQIALLQNFAAQAVIAMENARLLGELRQRTEEVAELNRGLEARVTEQVEELGRVGRLKRFLAPQLAELIVSQGDEKILESHRREIVVVFCDLRGYTAFTETAEPEEVLDFLREYHGALGPLVAEYEGTLDQFSGDGIMVFFNDPVPIPDPAECAVRMAVAMRDAAGKLTDAWRRRGRDLGFGAGIAQGYATLGQIGFAERAGYTAIGTVCNLAARLCGEAKDGQILVAQRVAAALDGGVPLEEVGALALKGLTQPVVAFNVAEAGAASGRLRLV